MPQELIYDLYTVKKAVERIIPYLEDTGSSAHKAIYFDGWDGLAASAVLRAIAEDPPPSLKKKFNKILHIDCSRWKSRRALQRAIADKLELPQRTMAAFDRQDEEDDFNGVDEGSRAEIGDVARVIAESLIGYRCLVVFHNGSSDMVDLVSCGILQPDFFPTKVLWTFRGRLRLNPEIKERVDSSHLYIYKPITWWFDGNTAKLILDEATEVVNYIQHNNQSISPDIAARCISYVLWLNKKAGGTMDYNWATHASNYWVCDGIIEDGQLDESWEVSAALHQQIRLEDCSSHTVNFDDDQCTEHWKSVVYTSSDVEARTDIAVNPQLTTFFLAAKNGLQLPREMFQQSERLRVLKLSGCNFSFYWPPFHCCRTLRFLGLDCCKDQRHEDEDKKGRPVMGFFQSLWVLDISHTDWELDLSQDTLDKMAANIREIHIKKGRIWRSNLAWRRLQYLRKLQVIEPTSSWETGKKDEFTDMVKLELLDLSGNRTIQALPSMSTTTVLKTLVLDGCVGLRQVGPGLPPSLVSFSFVVRSSPKDAAGISSINLAGCVHLENFLLRGAFPVLEEINLSGASTRKLLDLRYQVVQVPRLRRLFLMGCKLLDLSGNSTMVVLPSLSCSSGLKTLILNGCIGLEHLDPHKFPQSLESFCLDAGVGEDGSRNAKISHIKMAGCVRLVNFRLRGALPMLEEVDLSHTAIKMLDLSKVVKVQSLKRILLVGCKQLCSIVWPERGMKQLKLLCIDTRGEDDTVRNASHDSSLVSLAQQEYCHAFISITDMRFFQSLLTTRRKFLWGEEDYKLNIYMSSSTGRDDRRIPNKGEMGSRSTAGQMTGHSQMLGSCSYTDVAAAVGTITSDHNDISTASAAQLQPLTTCHIEIGEGVSDVSNVDSVQESRAIVYVMDKAQSLHVHDSCSVTTVIPKYIMSASGEEIGYRSLKWCRVERCPNLDTVFHTNYDGSSFWFDRLDTFWAADLLMVRSIWSRGTPYSVVDYYSFAKLRVIHLHLCPRLQFVLPLSWRKTLSSLETLHIVCCGDLRQVFPVEAKFLNKIATKHPNGMLEFPKLKHLYLHHLSSLQQICEAKMFAPELETVYLRGCWGLRRLPATDRARLVTVDCEKDWWEKLEWDGLDVSHHPYLLAPRHSKYYKKRLLRTTVLR